MPPWYRQLRIKTRDHIESGDAPTLCIAPKPDTAKEWRIRQQVLAEMRNEVDTFGLIEAGIGQDDQEDALSATDDEWNY